MNADSATGSQTKYPKGVRCPLIEWRFALRRALWLLLVAVPTAIAQPNLSNLLTILADAPQGTWVQVNLNNISDQFTPQDLQPLPYAGPDAPLALINAWSSFAWDSNRGDLIIFGGGHANYAGNEVYRWHGTTQLWERASVPSEVVALDLPSLSYSAIDGPMNAPVSSHTYDNQLFLPHLDRFITFGGAAFNSGAPFPIKLPDGTLRTTGPYFWNPALGDPNKVGGTTGSHVQRIAPHPEVVGGQMWQSRDLFSTRVPEANVSGFLNGLSDYAYEKGLDTVYKTANDKLFRYQAPNIADPTSDTWEWVGTSITAIWSTQGAGAYDPVRKIFLRTGTAVTPLAYWNMQSPGPGNLDAYVTGINDLSGIFAMNPNFGLDFDAARNVFVAWGGGGQVWNITPPSVTGPAGWVVSLDSVASGAVPDANVGTGVLGKFKYIPNLHAFMALQGPIAGNVWLYKPVGWTAPGPDSPPPTVQLTAPANGVTTAAGVAFTVSANASDNGAITQVEFYRNGALIGADTAPPYSLTDVVPLAGSYQYTARAYDNSGNVTISAASTVTVTAIANGTVTLQDTAGLYTGTRDTFLDPSNVNSARGGVSATLLNTTPPNYADLVRFAVFQSEGGPVPNGATITSATLSLYALTPYNYSYQLLRVLHDWSEGHATWLATNLGTLWASAGASGVGTDIAATPDAQTSSGSNPGWLDFNVTAALQAMAQGSANFGWRLALGTGNFNDKNFAAREYATPSLRPKLVVTFQTNSGGNPAPTVSLTAPTAGAAFIALANIVVSANAQDSNGIARVEFYRDGSIIATDTAAPYTTTDSNVPAGGHSYTAIAYDTLNASTSSSPVTVAVNAPANQAPTINLTAPVANAVFIAPANIVVTANAQDAEGPVARVDFYRDGTLFATITAAPFTVTDLNVALGIHTYTATATDSGGLQTTSAPITATVNPAPNQPPIVSLTAPVANATFTSPASITVTANVQDPDTNGAITSVEFYRNGTLFSTVSAPPYSVNDTNVSFGNYSYTAKAYDNSGASTVSAAISVTVNPPASGTITLQDVAGGYAGTRDTYLDPFNPNYAGWGTSSTLINNNGSSTGYADLVRFAVFQSEGGPVPNGATITAATLSLYKNSAYDYVYQVNRVLRDWVESQASWSVARTGLAWSVAGANGVGTDIATTADAQASVGFNPGWADFNVTSAIQAMSTNGGNFGWRVMPISGNINLKTFAAREFGTSVLRPKLVITYQSSGGTNAPPSVAMTAPSANASFTVPANIALSANASDSNGISKVEFYRSGTLIGTATVAPYSFTDSAVGVGNYSYTAIAYDTLGASTTSSPAVAVSVNATANTAPTVSLTSPTVGQSFTAPASVNVTANASDPDVGGAISKVEFYRNNVLFATVTQAPYAATDANVTANTYAYTAKAYDNLNASTVSTAITITVAAASTGGTVTLQDTVGGYSGTRDTTLDPFNPNYTGRGTSSQLLNNTPNNYGDLVRFAIYQSEGGPVPDGATITAATLSVFKTSSYDYTYQVKHVLKDWLESEATWNVARTGLAWSTPGAAGISDISATPDAQASAGWNPGWVDFNVKAAVQSMSTSGGNFGWRIMPISGNGNDKTFAAREYTTNTQLRPKMVITYTVP